jgi:hypothetical protein
MFTVKFSGAKSVALILIAFHERGMLALLDNTTAARSVWIPSMDT